MDEKTEQIIRKDYFDKITDWLLEYKNRAYHNNCAAVIEALEQLTILQLRAIYKLICRGGLLVLSEVPGKDYYSVEYCGAFTGIEKDGYTHQ